MTKLHVSTQSLPRLIRMPEITDAHGEPLIAVLPPGPRAVPVLYRTLEAALADKARMEAAQ